jgi:hypothetical protein
MVDAIAVAFVIGGLILLFAGAALSVYGVAALGVVVGGGVGFLFAPAVGGLVGVTGLAGVVVATGIGVVAGLVVTRMLLSAAVGAVGFVVGTYAGLVAVAPLVGVSGLLIYPLGLAVGIGTAVLGSFMTRTTMVLVTSFVGAVLVSGSLTPGDLATAQRELALEPLVFEVGSPVFLGLFALGVLSQFGLFKFGYVTKVVGLLPGASVLTDRGRNEGERPQS